MSPCVDLIHCFFVFCILLPTVAINYSVDSDFLFDSIFSYGPLLSGAGSLNSSRRNRLSGGMLHNEKNEQMYGFAFPPTFSYFFFFYSQTIENHLSKRLAHSALLSRILLPKRALICGVPGVYSPILCSLRNEIIYKWHSVTCFFPFSVYQTSLKAHT